VDPAAAVVSRRVRVRGHHHGSRGGELEGVPDEIHQDLPEAGRVADDRVRRAGVRKIREVETLLRRLRCEELERLLD
jgi:hypothetical protein